MANRTKNQAAAQKLQRQAISASPEDGRNHINRKPSSVGERCAMPISINHGSATATAKLKIGTYFADECLHECRKAGVLSTTILLVEDNKTQKMACERILLRAGFLVLCAMDGEQAVSVAREKRPDIILLDMLLPKMSGMQVLQSLQQDGVTARIPVIVLSALPQANEARLRALGAVAYFVKSRLFESKAGEIELLGLLERTAREGREQNTATAG